MGDDAKLNDTHPVSTSALDEPPFRRVLRGLARHILSLAPGDQLPTTGYLQSELDVAAGTVQKAVASLVDAGVIEVTSHGHRGRVLQAYSIRSLWPLAEFPVLHVEFPAVRPPEMLRLRERLEVGLGDISVPIAIRSHAGALSRLTRLGQGDSSMIVVSAGFWNSLPAARRAKIQARRMGPDSYYADDSIKVVQKEDKGPERSGTLRVGIDSGSYDHRTLTEAEFPSSSDIEYVECSFPNIPVDVVRDRIDVGLWHETETLFAPSDCGLSLSSLQSPASRSLRSELSEAIVLMDADNAALYRALDAAIGAPDSAHA